MRTPPDPSKDDPRDAGPDGDEAASAQKLAGDMLVLTAAIMGFASVLWLALYWGMGYRYGVNIAFAFQVLSAVTIALYLRTRHLELFAMIQLALILFAPFAMQWSIGDFVTASGVSLWGLMAPIGAMTVLGTRASMPWFFAWIFMTVMAGAFDYLLAGAPVRVDMRTVSVFFVLNFVTIAAMIYTLLWHFAAEKQRLRAQADRQREALHAERARSGRLLRKVLPDDVAQRQGEAGTVAAQGYEEVTVLFAAISGFARMSGDASPAESLKMLNDVLDILDEAAGRHGVERVRTVGEAYVAAAGMGGARPGDAAGAVAEAALEMLERVEAFRGRTGEKVALRIGVGTGPAITGLVGRRKFLFDLVGEPANAAARLASHAAAGGILADMATYRQLQERYRFEAPRDIPFGAGGVQQACALLGRR